MSAATIVQTFANLLGLDCQCCPTTPVNPKCATSLTLDFLNFDGSRSYCFAPSLVAYTITGTTTANKPITITGQANISSPNYRLSLSYNGDQLPAGSYTLAISEQAATCGNPVGDVGRFSTAGMPFKVACPTTTVSLTTAAAFDLEQIQANWGFGGCQQYPDGNGGMVDAIRAANLQVAVQVGGGATLCSSVSSNAAAAYHNPGNIGGATAWVRITSYPFTLKTSATGNHVLPADETRTYSACGSYSSDWQTSPYVFCDQFSISASSACAAGPLAGVQFAVSGGLTGSGTTTATDPPHYLTLTSFVQDKTGTTGAQLTVNYTATRDRFQAVTGSISGANGPVMQGCGLVAANMQPDSPRYYCAGCQLPAPATLYGSANGKSFAVPFVAQSVNGINQWAAGFASDPMPCVDCNGNPITASVWFQLTFSGLTVTGPTANQNPGLVLSYSCIPSTNAPTNCNKNASCGVVYDNASYGGPGYTDTESCVPFMGSVKGTWSYTLNNGGSYYHVPITLTISE